MTVRLSSGTALTARRKKGVVIKFLLTSYLAKVVRGGPGKIAILFGDRMPMRLCQEYRAWKNMNWANPISI